MLAFADILATAELHKGGSAAVKKLLPKVATARQLMGKDDAYYLSMMSLRVFRAGLKHELVDRKWPAFEKAFHNFDPYDVLMMSDEDLEAQMHNRDIIRHFGKIRSIRSNAQMVREISQEFGSFGKFLADWPAETLCELWFMLKKKGAQLGGLSAPRFLRMVGKDTFVLTDDVVASLMSQEILDKKPTAQRDIRQAQQAFNQWHEESGLPMAHISRIISFTANVR